MDPSRFALPEELANVVLFLASDDVRSISGDNIIVTGARGR
jgi:hypothetical protein